MANTEPQDRDHLWVGIDAGKHAHHAAAVDAQGHLVWSRPVANDQAGIEKLIAQAAATAHQVVWAVDLVCANAALLLAVLLEAGQQVVYVPGRTVNRMAAAFAGESKTDAKDAQVIANTARMRRDLLPATAPEELLAELGLLLGYRRDLMADWVRGISRLRQLLTAIFPALERALDYSTRSALILVEHYQTPQALRRAGQARIESYLRAHGAHKPSITALAERALAAGHAQTARLPGQDIAAGLITRLAGDLLHLDRRIKEADKQIAAAFHTHPQARVIESLPGMGAHLGAEFVVAVGDLSTFPDAAHVAAYAGLAPVAHDSGRIRGNLHRPRCYNRVLRRVFYLSALSGLNDYGPNRAFYQRKRAEGKSHQQAVLALARRRVDVLWALLRDGRCFTAAPPVTGKAA